MDRLFKHSKLKHNGLLPISFIGDKQLQDVTKSTGIICFNDIARLCTIIKKPTALDNRRDLSPYRLQTLFGGFLEEYNTHFIIQVSNCPLSCYYCYVDNKKTNVYLSAKEIVDKFLEFQILSGIDVKVLHIMGGAPAVQCSFWPVLRKAMDRVGLYETILLSDTILLENHFYQVKPWDYMNLHHFMLIGCLKGTNPVNFAFNTGVAPELFGIALKELGHYMACNNFYLTLIGYDPKDLDEIYEQYPRDRIDLLKIIKYKAFGQKDT